MQVEQIKFTPNKFESFTAKKTFTLGVTQINIVEGGEVLFDGSVVIVDDQRIPYPNLRGAVKMGWLVPTSTYDADVTLAPASANIQVRNAVGTQQNAGQPVGKSMISTVQNDERIVMTQTQRKESRTELASMKRTATSRTSGERGSDGVELKRTFKTPARSETKVTVETAGAAINEVNNVKIEPGEGLSEDQYLNRLDDDSREEYLSKKSAAKAVRLDELKEKGLATPVAKISSKSTGTKMVDGISSVVTTGGGTEIADLSGLDSGKAESSTTMVEGMAFKNLNGPKKAFQASVASSAVSGQVGESRIGKDGTADARKRIAKALCADFPEDYSFEEHWKTRLARLRLNYVDRHDVIQAVFAAESDDFKRVLIEEFPEAFGGN
jgi:hypothetical protein